MRRSIVGATGNERESVFSLLQKEQGHGNGKREEGREYKGPDQALQV